ATYFDEGTGSNQPLPAGTQLRAAFTLTAPSSNVGVTALTEAAVQRAESLAGGGATPALTPTLIAEANALVNSAFGVANILQAPALIGSAADYAALLNASGAATQYALRLAALARAAADTLPAGTASPAVAMLDALSADLADGKLDQAGPGFPTTLIPYANVAGLQQDLIDALNALLTALAADPQLALSQAQIAALTTLAGNIVIDPTPYIVPTCTGMGLPVASASAISEFVGTYPVEIYAASGTTGPVNLTLAANGAVTLSGATATAREICGPTNNSGGSSYLIISNTKAAGGNELAMFNLYKANDGTLSIEGLNISGATQTSFYGTKQGSGGNPNPNPGGTGDVVFGSTTYSLQTAPAGAAQAPGQLVWDGEKFVGLEQSKDFHNPSAKFAVWVSGDGKNWTRSLTDLNSHGVAMAGMNNKVFQVLPAWQSGGTFGDVAVSSSSDGITWQTATVTNSGFSTSVLQGGKYLNSRYFLSTDTDCMLITSTDATNWTTVDLKTVTATGVSTQPSGYCTQPVVRSGNLFVYRGVVGVGGTFRAPDHYEGAYYTSTDGLTWSFGTFALPAGFTKITTGGRSAEVQEVGNTLIIPSVQKTEMVRDPVSGFLSEVVLDSKVATSSDGINWTFSDASGLTYSNFVVGKPGASASYFQNELGLLTTDYNNKYYFTGNGISYVSTPDLGLLFDSASNSQRR
ncbi:MAG TPA: hypothetical protein VFW49_07715, partial [Fluviicoccus sp.]|nr:hypothetical protein [Fluviicoccus sp.]